MALSAVLKRLVGKDSLGIFGALDVASYTLDWGA